MMFLKFLWWQWLNLSDLLQMFLIIAVWITLSVASLFIFNAIVGFIVAIGPLVLTMGAMIVTVIIEQYEIFMEERGDEIVRKLKGE